MWSFEVHYVVVAQKISPFEGAKYEKNHHTSAPPIHTSFKLHEHNVPQKITFFMKIYDFEKKNYASKWKNWKKSILLFSSYSE